MSSQRITNLQLYLLNHACYPTGARPDVPQALQLYARLPSDPASVQDHHDVGPDANRHPVSRLGTLEGGEGACSRRCNSPG